MMISHQGTPPPRKRLDLLVRPSFLAALVLLLLNDHWWKAAWPSFVTGKLSDFAGLYVFAVLLLALLPRQRLPLLWGTALAFVYWKSPLSQPMIEAWNALLPYSLARTVDALDLAALAVLPMAGLSLRKALRKPARLWARATRLSVGIVTLLAIAATSKGPVVDAELQRVREQMVTEYDYSVRDLERHLDRLKRLTARLPDAAHLPPGSKREEYREGPFLAVTFNLPGYFTYGWRQYDEPAKATEYNIVHRRHCDQLLADKAPRQAIPSFHSASIKYRWNRGAPSIRRLELTYCDLPARRNEEEALTHFMGEVLPEVEAGLGL